MPPVPSAIFNDFNHNPSLPCWLTTNFSVGDGYFCIRCLTHGLKVTILSDRAGCVSCEHGPLGCSALVAKRDAKSQDHVFYTSFVIQDRLCSSACGVDFHEEYSGSTSPVGLRPRRRHFAAFAGLSLSVQYALLRFRAFCPPLCAKHVK